MKRNRTLGAMLPFLRAASQVERISWWAPLAPLADVVMVETVVTVTPGYIKEAIVICVF
jgi:hypothetical protein